MEFDLKDVLLQRNIRINPPPGAAFALNIIVHILLLFLALTVLYKYVVAPMETGALQQEVNDKIKDCIVSQYDNLPAAQKEKLRDSLKAARPFLEKLEISYATEDPLRVLNNETVFSYAWIIVAGLALLLVVVLSVFAAARVTIGRTFLHVLMENAFIFTVIGLIEFSFFKLVATKFIPVMPSQLGKNALQALKESFGV